MILGYGQRKTCSCEFNVRLMNVEMLSPPPEPRGEDTPVAWRNHVVREMSRTCILAIRVYNEWVIIDSVITVVKKLRVAIIKR